MAIMNVKHIKKTTLTTSKWSGGTTTQLAIYPEDGDYSKREFVWRLSSAVVEVETSNFTKLPNTKRILMILDGELLLSHEARYNKTLKRFDQDSFSGGWQTSSEGVVTDFNLMMKGNAVGRLSHKTIIDSGAVKFPNSALESNEKHEHLSKGIYCAQGTGHVEIEGECFIIGAGDLIMVNMSRDEDHEKTMVMSGNLELVIIDLSY